MDLKIKVGPIGALDMLRFKNQAKVREAAIEAAPDRPIRAVFATNEGAHRLHPAAQYLTVAQILPQPDARTFVLEKPDGAAVAPFRAGQYLSVSLQIGESLLTRPYTIASSPRLAQAGRYAITVKRMPGGFASDYILENWDVGTQVAVSGPLGEFCYEPLRDAPHVVALAGGSGITPFLSMAHAIRDGLENFRLTILCGSRTEAQILHREELEALAADCPGLEVFHILSEEKRPGFEHGFFTAARIREALGEEDGSVFLCGPEAMYRFAEGELAQLSLRPGRVRRETSGAPKQVAALPGYPEACRGRTFSLTVRRFGAEQVVPAAAEEPLLCALERAGIAAPSHCRSGECGFCRSHLVSGEVYLPEAWDGRRWADRANGEIHPCVSYPLSDLTLELPSILPD